MVRRTKIILLMLMLVVSVVGNARKLTTTDIRENSIRINALEIETIEFYNYNMQIVGHTDSKGAEDYNMRLGQRRADSVKAKLLELGLDSSRILGTSSMGETEPVATNDTKEGRFQNRRIEFKLELRENK